jgi:hypothetical protein
MGVPARKVVAGEMQDNPEAKKFDSLKAIDVVVLHRNTGAEPQVLEVDAISNDPGSAFRQVPFEHMYDEAHGLSLSQDPPCMPLQNP